MTPEQMIERIEQESSSFKSVVERRNNHGMNSYAESLAESVLADLAREFRQQLEAEQEGGEP